MNKKKEIALISLITVVLCAMVILLIFSIPKKSYSLGQCLNDQINDEMSLNDIAEVYSTGCVSVIMTAKSKGGKTITKLGSGVCVASNGYSTSLGYTAQKGSYFVTNYHVISNVLDKFYSDYTTSIAIETDGSPLRYSASLLWADRNLDVAVIYCDDVASGYIKMADRVVSCDDEQKLGYDDIFTIGTPLSLSYKNTFTKGSVANKNKALVETVEETLYTYFAEDQLFYTTDAASAPKSATKTDVCSNVYENVVLMNCDITNGNSGGGVFDGNGKLIGLSTLGIDNSQANTAAFNFFVPIYPVTLVLDRLIYSNENNVDSNIINFDELKFNFMDQNESSICSSTPISSNYYYYQGQLYWASTYNEVFSFDQDGVVIIDSQIENLSRGHVITGASKNGQYEPIETRNDFKFFLLKCSKGDTIELRRAVDANANTYQKIEITL